MSLFSGSFFKSALSLAAIVGAAVATQGMFIGWQMAATFAASIVVSRIFAPNVPTTQQNNIRQQVPPDPTAGIPIVYGTAYTGGRFVDATLITNQQAMYYVMAISNISPNGQFTFDQSKFYYQDQLITFDGTDLTKVVSLTDGAGNVNTSISGRLYIWLFTSNQAGTITPINSGSQPSAVMSTAVGIPSGQEWAASGRQMNGLAFAIVKLIYDTGSSGTTSLQPITFHVSHTLNGTGVAKPGDVWYDYLTNPVYGGAVSTSFVDSASATALNNYSDQTISYIDYNGVTQTQPRYRFNGVIDTGQTVLSNIDIMMNCCDSWQAYNASTGLWSVVINKDIVPSFAFDDTNIVGNIDVGALDITQQVNQVEGKFNDATNRDQPGYVNLNLQTLNPSLLYPNEPVNKYSVSYDLINDSVTAQYLATRILEQNRLDLIVNFSSTYAGIQVNAGDVVTVTNSAYGWTSKQFRVMQVKESVLADGTLGASFQLAAYDSTVYTISNIQQYHPTPNSGLTSVNYFATLTAPSVTGYPAATIPHFDVGCVVPTTGRVTFLNLYYTTSATPSSTDWQLLSIANSAGNIPIINGTTYVFSNQVLPVGTYYFAYIVGNDVSQTPISAKSASFVWNPTGLIGPTGPTGSIGPTGGSGSNGPRNSTGFVYYQLSSPSAPSAPTLSGYNFSTGTFSTISTNWTTTFSPPDPATNPSTQAGSLFWAVRYYVVESTFGGSQTITVSSVFNWQNLNGLVTFTNVSTSSGTTFIDGGNITANTINVNKLIAGLLVGYTLRTGSGHTPNGYSFEVNSSGTVWADNLVGGVGYFNNSYYTGTNALVSYSYGANEGFIGAGSASNYSSSAHGVRGVNYRLGTSGLVGVANGYDFYADGTGTNYGPFTGTHDSLVPIGATFTVGDIVIDQQIIEKNGISSTISLVAASTSANQQGALGVVCNAPSALNQQQPAAFIESIAEVDGKTVVTMKPSYYTSCETYNFMAVNAVGEGQINVCGEGGNIAIGDLICTSNTAGKGMKQADDVVHSYTVAKAREAATFTSAGQVQMIACIYISG